MQAIYLDNNATTLVLPAVWEAMQPYFTDVYGNPASAHALGRPARRALDDARERIAAILGAFPDEVVFTSGATEANNLALLGLAGDPPGRVITSPVEHPSVSEPVLRLEGLGFSVERLSVDREGKVDPAELHQRLGEDARLVSVMLANHETGTVQLIGDLAKLCAGRCAFHCDAVQAVGKIPVHFHELGVTTLSMSAHKFHGPKGVGALLIRRGTRLRPLCLGGHQQDGRRPGTEPVALVVGMAKALELARDEAAARTAAVVLLRSRFLDILRSGAAPVVVNGPTREPLVPHTLNVSFPGCAADSLLMNLDLAGVACSTGSACSSGSLLPSPVLVAMGVPDDVLRSAMRFSFSPLLTASDAEEAARRVVAVVRRLRSEANV